MPGKYLKIVNKIIKIITFKKVIILAISGIIGVLSFTIFENSKTIYNVVSGDQFKSGSVETFNISEISKTNLRKFVDEIDVVSSIIILNVDIRHNQRIPVFWYSTEPNIQRALNTNYADKIVRMPVFSSSENANSEIVSILNGEFTCNRNNDVINMITSSDIKNKFLYLCSISIPPYYGQFSGYIIVTLNSLPEKPTLDTIKFEMINMTLDIYLRDIRPFNRFGGK